MNKLIKWDAKIVGVIMLLILFEKVTNIYLDAVAKSIWYIPFKLYSFYLLIGYWIILYGVIIIPLFYLGWYKDEQ